MSGTSGYKLDQPTVDAVIALITSYIETGQLPGGGGSTPLVGNLTSNSTTSALRADQGPVITGLISTAQTAANSAGTAAANAQSTANTAISRLDNLPAGSGLPTSIAPVTAIPLDGTKAFNADIFVSNTPFTVAAGQVTGGSCTLVIKGDGVLSPVFTGMKKAANSATFNTTLNAVNNVIVFEFGGRVYYNIWQADPVEVVTPTPSALTNIFTASGVTQSAGGVYAITGSGLKGSSAVSATGDFTLVADFTGNSTTIAFGVAVANTAGSWTAGFDYAVMDDVGGSRFSYVQNGTQQNPLSAGGWVSNAANRRGRVRRVGTTIYMEASSDAGSTWTTFQTVTGVSGTLYPVIGSFTTGGTLQLSGLGFA